jgi:hypothetical protein
VIARRVVAVLRLAAAAAAVTAVVAQYLKTLDNIERFDQDPAHEIVNYVSFFTIESNVAAAVVLVVGAVVLLRGAGRGGGDRGSMLDPMPLAVTRAVVATYLVITAAVYNLLLRGVPPALPDSTVPWADEIVHVVVPAAVLLDQLLAPGRRRLPWRTVPLALIYPVVWAVYTLVRAPIVGWYPYPFLDPATSGPVAVAAYVVGLELVIGAIAAVLVLVSRIGTARAPVGADSRSRSARQGSGDRGA